MMDFAENFSTRYQDECQSAHWCYDQITIHPSVCYYSDALGETVTHEVVYISNDLTRDTNFVDYCFKNCVNFLRTKNWSLKLCIQLTDGCSSLVLVFILILHCLTKHKASNEGYTRSIETTLDIKLDSSLLEFMFICEKCANACKHFNNFRGRAKQNLDNFISNHTTSRTKRMPKTPPSAMKISTADQIENSVEKLRNLNLDEKEKGARVTKKSRQQLNFNKDLNLEHAYSQHNILKHQEEDQVVLLQDHEYSIPNIMDKALETNEKIAEDFIKEACINSYNSHDGLDLDKQISSVCKLGKSVLFKSSAKRIGS
ncbi:unnamed protein product [Mytilus edulis]|uniref:Uncharacterized protein n=1 Tax=Mytilus edulis TaxID=6550 RepID=A0A8S3SFQ1_MYTED|nr:unnamed protein product [Mytilus edulis]